MTQPVDVLLTICSRQQFRDEKPEITRLITDGTMRRDGQTVELAYEESELTGLSGTKTTFRMTPQRVELERTGKVTSRMVFVPGQEDQSLYDMGFGALMIAVRAEKVRVKFNDDGGSARVSYAIGIEGQHAGRIDYRIDVQRKPPTAK